MTTSYTGREMAHLLVALRLTRPVFIEHGLFHAQDACEPILRFMGCSTYRAKQLSEELTERDWALVAYIDEETRDL